MSKWLIRVISVFTFYNLLLLSCISSAKASSIIFQDDFSKDLSKWEKTTPVDSSIWSIDQGMAKVSSFGQYITQLVPKDEYWDDYVKNIQIDFDLMYTAGIDQNFLMRYKSDPDFYELHFNGNLTLDRTIPSNTGQIISISPLPNILNHVKIEYLLSRIIVTLNGEKVFDYEDTNNPYVSGKIGLRVAEGNEVYYDNVIVTSLDPDPSPSPIPTPSPSPTPISTPAPTPSPINFPYYSQRDSRWKNDIYDHAKKWAPRNPTFERWGCGVTAASMILNYHGITKLPNGKLANPGNLNAWLKNQADGFVRGGQVNWSAISRATKLISLTNPFLPKLENTYLGKSLQKLKTELQNNRPVILEEPGHFVAAYQWNSNTNIDIADPFYEQRNKLSSYGNTFVSMRTFKPSFTDLSYILITADSDITITVEKKDGIEYEQVENGVTYVQQPLIDEISGDPADNEPYVVYELAKPSHGKYYVNVSKPPGIGSVEIYLYDQDGKFDIEEFYSLFGNEPRRFELTIREQKHSIQQIVGYDQLRSAILAARSMGSFKHGYLGVDLLSQLRASELLYPKNKRLSRAAFSLYEDILRKRRGAIDSHVYSMLLDLSETARSQLF